MGTTFLVLARMFAKGLFDFVTHKLCEISALRSFLIRLGPTCAPMIFDRSAILVEATAVMHVVTLERAPMFLAQDTVLIRPAHLLGLFDNLGVNGLHLALPFSPFWLDWMGSLGIKVGVVLDVL